MSYISQLIRGYIQVNSFVYAPNAPHYDTELLEPSFSGSKFVLKSKSGYERESEVTEQERERERERERD